MKLIYWTPFGELRSVTFDDNGTSNIAYHSHFDLKDLLARGYVEISERSARAMYLPV